MRADKKTPLKADKKVPSRGHKRGVIGYSKKSALLEDAITQMNAGKYGRSSAALKELLALDPLNMEARRLFATLHLRLGSLLPARQAFESLANEALERQDYWLAESLLREYLVAGPRCVPFIEKLGAVYQEKGDALAASEEFAKAIDILIEDPDPDRPDRPTELYAKIRELAPASPPAFRLAVLFDAQSGELIARVTNTPASEPAELQFSSSAVDSSEPIIPSGMTAMADPVSGVMPWDDMPTGSPVEPVQNQQRESPDLVASLSTASGELPAESLVASLISSPVDESSHVFVETAQANVDLILSDSTRDSDAPAPAASYAAVPASMSPGDEGTPGTDDASPASVWGLSSLPIPQDSGNAISSELPGADKAGILFQSDAVALSASPASDSFPAPLPWEQVQDTTVAIPQADGESVSTDLHLVETSSADPSEPPPVELVNAEEPGEKQEEELLVLADPGTTLLSATTAEFSPDVVWSAPDGGAATVVDFSVKPSELSLKNSILEEQQSDAAAESVPSPMPWEQVQESSVSIEGFAQDSIGFHATTTGSSPVSFQEIPVAEVGDEVAPEAIATTSESDIVESHDAGFLSPADVSSQSQRPEISGPSRKVGEFSWASIFNSAWKFGSSSPAPHDSLHHVSPVDSPEVVAAPVPLEELATAVSSGEISESMSVAASSEQQAASPMPEDHIQEGPATVPPAEIVLSSATEPLCELPVSQVQIPDSLVTLNESPANSFLQVESNALSPSLAEPAASPIFWGHNQETPVTNLLSEIALSSAVEALGKLPAPATPVERPDEGVVEEATGGSALMASPTELVNVPLENSSPVEVAQINVEEPSFRFMDSEEAVVKSGPSHDGAWTNVPAGGDEKKAEASPVADPLLTAEPVPVQVEAFRIAQQTESPAVAPEAIAPVMNAAPGPTAPGEAASPVLPRELLPVLQTLVDQLSGATKAIPVISTETPPPGSTPHTWESAPTKTTLREPSEAPSSAELAANPASAQMPPTEAGPPSQWKTGEVAVQPHRPSAKKGTHLIDRAPESLPHMFPADDQRKSQIESVSQVDPPVVEPVASASVPVQEKEEWVRTGEAIRFIDPIATEPAHLMPPPPAVQAEWAAASVSSPAASAVDVLFQSSGRHLGSQTIERAAAPKTRPWLSVRLSRIRIGLSVFIGSCFSTTRALVASIVGLAVLCVAIMAMAVGAVGLTWLMMEEKPSPAFQSLTTTPQRSTIDSSKNGYLLLLGFEAEALADPVQAGYERKPAAKDGEMAAVCQDGEAEAAGANQRNASASVAQGWYRSGDPAGQFKANTDSIKGWIGQASGSVSRYRQWLKMPFEDWGHGQSVTPPCAAVLFAHRLFVAEGFSQELSPEVGVERLENDTEVWRTTLAQAKSLPIKTMALQAINDNIAVASGLLVKPDFDGKLLPRITKMLRPLDPVESSMRWPMQSQLVLATKSYAAQLEADRGEDVPLHVSVASMLPLPKQRRFNDYAEYYEASYKAAGEGRYGAMPKRSIYIKHPATTVMDYLTNPIENLIGVDPLPAWDHYNGLVIDTDAHLRLGSLQAWLRRGPQDADLLARIAKAGQRLYDPYTGLPMLVNLRRGVMYSVGHDGKDQDADPHQDVVVSIPLNQSVPASAKPAPKSK